MNILELFNIPNKAQVDRRIFVKDILARLELSSRDKQFFEKTVGTINVKGKVYKLKDTKFPTIDPKNPYKLTKEEEAVIDKLASSFKNSEKIYPN